jgi:hypothetical protein
MFKLFRKVKDAFHLRQQSHNRQLRAVASTNDARRMRRAARRAEEIRSFCELGRMHARSMRDSSLDPELAAHERKGYELYKRDALALTRRVKDPVLRDCSVGHIIDLCLDGGEEEQARALFDVVQSDFVKRYISGKHPQLAAEQVIRSSVA